MPPVPHFGFSCYPAIQGPYHAYMVKLIYLMQSSIRTQSQNENKQWCLRGVSASVEDSAWCSKGVSMHGHMWGMARGMNFNVE
jgi:hypothetical protein